MSEKAVTFENRGLFSNHYLENKLAENNKLWLDREKEIQKTFDECKKIFNEAMKFNLGVGEEASLEEHLIRPIFKVLGFEYTVQAPINNMHADYALYLSEENKLKGERDKNNLWDYAQVVGEVKYYGRRLNDTEKGKGKSSNDPTRQIFGYLNDLNKVLNKNIDWGILTNGQKWRLFKYISNPLANYYEVNLEQIIQSNNLDQFKYFYLFFSKNAFVEDPQTNESWLDIFIKGSEEYAKVIQEKIKNLIFDEIFEDLAKGFIKYRKEIKGINSETDESLKEIFDGCLTLLYRMLFILYAESMELLPIRESAYLRMSLKKIKEDINNVGIDELSGKSDSYYGHFSSLCRIISLGDKDINVPIYNGGLFSDENNGFLKENKVFDPVFARVIKKLTIDLKEHSKSGLVHYYDYSSLGVRQLGDIYEGLLEFHLKIADEDMVCVREKKKLVWMSKSNWESAKSNSTIIEERKIGEIYIENSNRERKSTGSYFTPRFIVEYIVENAVGEVLKEKIRECDDLMVKYEKAILDYKKLKSPKPQDRHKIDKLKEKTFNKLFSIKVLDPAMGSGHFLVYAVDFISQQINNFLIEHPENPVIEKIQKLKNDLINSIKSQEITVDENKITEINLIRRMVMKRCIYGVDLNYMAVELAKLSLWLDSFTLGAPLSFLDHHLKYGNSLIGSEVKDVRDNIEGLLWGDEFRKRLLATDMYNKLAAIPDTTINEVEQSKNLFIDAEKEIKPIKKILDIHLTQHFDKEISKEKVNNILSMHGMTIIKNHDSLEDDNKKVFELGEKLQKEIGFFHWELEFPEVWYDKGSRLDNAGFDSVIGNPPWERVKLQENEFFPKYSYEITFAPTSAKRNELIKKLPETNPILWELYSNAKNRAENISLYLRKCGKYPLLGRGDVNYYSIFTEQSLNLISDKGRTSLVIPSGIATDKTASDFFSSIVENKRLSTLLDFENRKGHFATVDNRFKYSIIVIGGLEANITDIKCAFFLHNPEDINDKNRLIELSNEDFQLVNPNTKNSPLFLSQRDADIVIGIYKKVPILISKSEKEINEWNIKFSSMFHMANDSQFFKTLSELEKDGFWLDENNHFNKGKEKYLPLFEGKMVQMYDYRAAKIKVNPSNLRRPSSPVPLTEEEHKDANLTPPSQFWVPEKEIINRIPDVNKKWFVGYKAITSPTNIRTMITSIIPYSGAGHSLFIMFPMRIEAKKVSCLLGNLNAFILDFILRKKIGGQNISYFIVEQLPIFPPSKYDSDFNGLNLKEFISKRVLELIYTAHTIRDFAIDLGYEDKPFVWDKERRIHLMSQLDALYFLLYDVSMDDLSYVMDSFPIVKKQDEEEYGYFRTKKLIETYYRAYQSGDFDAWVKG